MCKLFGATLIIICGVLLSCTPLLKMMGRKQLLSEWIFMLERMRSELRTAAPTLPQLVKRLEGEYAVLQYIDLAIEENGPMAFYDAWDLCISNESYFREEEQDVLRSLGTVLGRYVMEEQLNAIDRTLELLRAGCSSADSQLREVSRLYIGMGLSVSAMLVIVLL